MISNDNIMIEIQIAKPKPAFLSLFIYQIVFM